MFELDIALDFPLLTIPDSKFSSTKFLEEQINAQRWTSEPERFALVKREIAKDSLSYQQRVVLKFAFGCWSVRSTNYATIEYGVTTLMSLRKENAADFSFSDLSFATAIGLYELKKYHEATITTEGFCKESAIGRRNCLNALMQEKIRKRLIITASLGATSLAALGLAGLVVLVFAWKLR